MPTPAPPAAQIDASTDTQSLLAEVMLNISFTLHHALGRLRGAEPEAIRALMASLPAGLISVTHTPGQRRVSVCDGAAYYTVKTITPSQEQQGQSQGLFAGEAALLEWQDAEAGRKPADPLATPSASAWHIMVLEMLYRRLDVWLTQYCPHARNDAFIRHTAKLAAQSVPAQAALLNLALYDAMGVPRDLLAWLERHATRANRDLPAIMKNALSYSWPAREQWPGMSRKLFPLAAVAHYQGTSAAADPRSVRDGYLQQGLTRNAWRHLMRLPSSVLMHIAIILALTPERGGRELLLRELSQALSRLGNAFCYYRLERDRLVVALVWLVYEAARLDDAESAAKSAKLSDLADYMPDRMFGYVMMISRLDIAPTLHERFRLLAISFSRELLESPRNFDDMMGDLSLALDWFVAQGECLPANAFKVSFSRLHTHAQRWHEQLLREQEEARRRRRAEEDALIDRFGGRFGIDEIRELMLDPRWRNQEIGVKDGGNMVWSARVPLFEHEHISFHALTSSQMLDEEGDVMQHCVGGYTNTCLKGDVLIYSVRDKGKRLGTLELYHNAANNWYAVQFMGKRNRNLMPMIRRNGTLEPAYRALRQALLRG